jgi:hypothetical protein
MSLEGGIQFTYSLIFTLFQWKKCNSMIFRANRRRNCVTKNIFWQNVVDIRSFRPREHIFFSFLHEWHFNICRRRLLYLPQIPLAVVKNSHPITTIQSLQGIGVRCIDGRGPNGRLQRTKYWFDIKAHCTLSWQETSRKKIFSWNENTWWTFMILGMCAGFAFSSRCAYESICLLSTCNT